MPEGPWAFFARVCIGLPGTLLIFVYLFLPRSLGWANVPLSPLWRWIGVGIFSAALPFLFWIQSSLGENFSPELRIRTNHHLISSGPYRYVRHPMYTASLVIYASMGLVSANWFIGGTGVLATLVIMIWRTPREEAMLVTAFGDEYCRYIELTGKFLPRIRFARPESGVAN